MGVTEEFSSTAKEIISKVKCPYQVFKSPTTAGEVRSAYANAFELGKKEGFVPVLVIADETMAEWLGILEDESYSKEKIIAEARDDGEAILKERLEGYISDYDSDGMSMEELLGEKADGEVITELSSFISWNSDESIQETILFEIPVKNVWEVIAWLPMGGWNECPEASEMMAVCKYWYEKYGAVVSVVSHDTLELSLNKSISDDAAAWELAKEHFAFCPDRVDQGTNSGTIGEVADCISKSSVWYFWWD